MTRKLDLAKAAVCAVLMCMPVSVLYAQTTYHQRHFFIYVYASKQFIIIIFVADGQITPKGAAAADSHQARINSEESSMRAADGGHLTAADRHKVARQQDRSSQRIYNRNHNAATDPGVPPQ